MKPFGVSRIITSEIGVITMRRRFSNKVSQSHIAAQRLPQAVSERAPVNEEALLVERAKNDPEAFGVLYDAHYGAILRYLYRRTLDIHLAEDLCSNTFFNALRSLKKYRHRAPFSAWLYRIATNELKTHWRKLKTRHTKISSSQWQSEIERVHFNSRPTETIEDRDERLRAYEQLHNKLRDLPEPYQTALILRYIEEMSNKEICHVLGKRSGAVKSLIHRGLKKLAARFERDTETSSADQHCKG